MGGISNDIVALATVAGSMITILALVAAIGKTIKWLADLPNAIRNYMFKPKYVIIPTPEELAKYSIKSFEFKKEAMGEIYEEAFSEYKKYIMLMERLRRSRLNVMICVAFIIFYFFVTRLAYLGYANVTRDPDTKWKTLWFMLVITTVGFVLNVLLRERDEAFKLGKWLGARFWND